jgi:hypothetical protein
MKSVAVALCSGGSTPFVEPAAFGVGVTSKPEPVVQLARTRINRAPTTMPGLALPDRPLHVRNPQRSNLIRSRKIDHRQASSGSAAACRRLLRPNKLRDLYTIEARRYGTQLADRRSERIWSQQRSAAVAIAIKARTHASFS